MTINLPQASLLAMAAKDLAGNLPQIGTLVLAPDLLALGLCELLLAVGLSDGSALPAG